MCENYLTLTHKEDIIRILVDPDKDKHFSLIMNFLELFESDLNLGNALLADSESSLKDWNEAVFNVQNNLIKELDKKCTLKNNVNCRIYSLPPWPHVSRTVFPGNDDADNFLQLTGTVVRMSARKLLEYQRQYVCVKCKYPITVEATYDKRNIIKQPKKCTNPEGCSCKNIISFGELDPYNCKDYQEIKIQEDLAKVEMGILPNTMLVTLEDDLVNSCKPGETVTITGTVKRRWSEFDKGAKIIVDLVLKANHVQVNNSSGLSIKVSDETRQFFSDFWIRHANEPLIGRNIILKSISPEIYGLQLVKLAIAIVLAGGSQNDDSPTSTGIDTRSESHLLLVGDPGTGKSQMLRFASKITPRSVLTTGVGSTAAGLTVTAIMENGEWQLEAGALVMSDGGMCCIDEFNSMREHDRTSIHEAMEQQTISVAKAGMVCKLKTRCSILASCNPKGNIDPSQPLCVNVAMSSPLLSRFDLILLLRDVVNEDNDEKLAEYLLNKQGQLSGDDNVWSVEKLQAYYSVIKKHNPKLTSEAEAILGTYYQLQRKFGSKNKSRTTVRLLESLVRLSQGHSKLMFHDEVQIIDAIFAIILVDVSMDYDASLLNLKVDYNSFAEDPQQLYWELLESILGKLGLDYIYQREIDQVGVGKIKKGSQSVDGDSPRGSQMLLFSQRNVLKKQGSTEYEDNIDKRSPIESRLLFSQRSCKKTPPRDEGAMEIEDLHAIRQNYEDSSQSSDVIESTPPTQESLPVKPKVCENLVKPSKRPNIKETVVTKQFKFVKKGIFDKIPSILQSQRSNSEEKVQNLPSKSLSSKSDSSVCLNQNRSAENIKKGSQSVDGDSLRGSQMLFSQRKQGSTEYEDNIDKQCPIESRPLFSQRSSIKTPPSEKGAMEIEDLPAETQNYAGSSQSSDVNKSTPQESSISRTSLLFGKSKDFENHVKPSKRPNIEETVGTKQFKFVRKGIFDKIPSILQSQRSNSEGNVQNLPSKSDSKVCKEKQIVGKTGKSMFSKCWSSTIDIDKLNEEINNLDNLGQSSHNDN